MNATSSPLFEPLCVRNLFVANRFVMSAMNRNCAPGGIPGDDLARYFRRRVDGETGLIVTGGIGIDHPAALGVAGERDCNVPELHGAALDGWRTLVDLVHAGGGKIVAQLWHQGPMRLPGTGYHPEAQSCRPSGVWGPTDRRSSVDAATRARFGEPTPALTDGEIVELVDAFERSARDAASAGFDGVEVHGSNGYLPDAFLWNETNVRSDRWGGGPRERARFGAEVVRVIRRAVGENVPIFYRFSQWKPQDLDAMVARTPVELEAVLGPLADAGVDVFDAQQLAFDRAEFPGSDMNLAGWAKKVTGRTSMTSGAVGLSHGLYDPAASGPPVSTDNLDALIRRFERDEFDLVGVARSLLQDPAWTRKARLGLPFATYDPSLLRVLN
jgi:2,4-dienoyl-CoA reductase-like NADH-dependent reductase (Old Yellow Enzyme family)